MIMPSSHRSIQTMALLVVLSGASFGCGGKSGGPSNDTTSSSGDGDDTTDSAAGDGDAGDTDGTSGDTDSTGVGDGDDDTTTSSGGDGDTTAGDGDGDTSDVTPGGACDVEGEQGNAACNTCTCENGHWLCTEIGCAVACDPADYPQDGCNPCSCVNGQVLCTDVYCPPETECVDGDTKAADDGCNTCTCAAGSWACTKKACVEELCAEYDTKTADDGCNTCTCSGGFWICTKEPCGLTACGARAGDTCADTEYCAYEEGDLCGAADAEAVCMARPELCTAHVAMVCGCDGKSYSNSCAAASAGTGVLHDGACDEKE